MEFNAINGLYLLGFLVPLIILYLIKAKPKEITIPSLLFFSDDRKTKKYNSILRKLLIRTLFFLQFFFIVLMALSAANPIIQIPIDVYSLSTVVVADVSASMKTKENGIQRIDLGKEELLKLVKGRVSIILPEEHPVILARNISALRARALLTNLEAKDISSRLDSSILFANDLLGEEKGNIIIYSDFNIMKDDAISEAKRFAESNDKRVIFVKTGTPQKNLGFVELNIFQNMKGEVFIKNFGDEKKAVNVRLYNNNNQKETKQLEVGQYSVERIDFDIPEGETHLQIVEKDALDTDNNLYLINPYKKGVNVLFITNDEKNNPLVDALQANSQFSIQITKPPVIPDLNQDLIFINKVNKEMLLPNTFRDIKRYKDQGGKVVITSQDMIDKLDFQELAEFRMGPLDKTEEDVCIDILNEITSRIGNPRCFTYTTEYYKASVNKNKSVVIAATKDGDPIFILENNLFYYGIIDEFSGFKDQINYPLFWTDVINYLLGRGNLENFNFKTGDMYYGGNHSEKNIFDKVGMHAKGGEKVAVNLLNEQESDTFREISISDETKAEGTYKKINLDINMDHYLLFLGIMLFSYELYYIKRRGDL